MLTVWYHAEHYVLTVIPCVRSGTIQCHRRDSTTQELIRTSCLCFYVRLAIKTVTVRHTWPGLSAAFIQVQVLFIWDWDVWPLRERFVFVWLASHFIIPAVPQVLYILLHVSHSVWTDPTALFELFLSYSQNKSRNKNSHGVQIEFTSRQWYSDSLWHARYSDGFFLHVSVHWHLTVLYFPVDYDGLQTAIQNVSPDYCTMWLETIIKLILFWPNPFSQNRVIWLWASMSVILSYWAKFCAICRHSLPKQTHTHTHTQRGMPLFKP